MCGMEDLSSLPNIGAILASKLHAAGISSYDDLVDAGSVGAVVRIKDDDRTACYNMLYALEGAIQGIRWHSIPKNERRALKVALDQAAGWLER